jgi:hypothetical protein
MDAVKKTTIKEEAEKIGHLMTINNSCTLEMVKYIANNLAKILLQVPKHLKQV